MDGDTGNDVPATYAIGNVYVSVGLPDVHIQHTFDASALSAGPHELMVVAYQGDSIATQGHARVHVVRRPLNAGGAPTQHTPLSAAPIGPP
jgi:hypothetical protein